MDKKTMAAIMIITIFAIVTIINISTSAPTLFGGGASGGAGWSGSW